MNWGDLIDGSRKWVETHQSSPYQAEAARRIAALCDAMESLLSDETVELVARELCHAEWPDKGDYEYHWEHFADQWYRPKALAALAAATRSPAATERGRKEAVARAARALNRDGWTCHGGEHEPGHYDDCADCKRICDKAATTALAAAAGKES